MTFDRISSGNPEADEILGGGFPSRSVNIIMGHPGTGKTIFVEQLLFASVGGRPILYFTTLSEPMSKVLKYLQRFSFFDAERLGSDVIYEDLGPLLAKDGIASLVGTIQDRIVEYQPKIVVIDSFKAVHDLADNVREMRILVYELIGLLSAYDTTAFLVGEYSEEQTRLYPEFAVADGIMQFLRGASSTRDERFLRVLKLRGSEYREGLHAFRVTGEGLQVFPRLVTPSVPVIYESLFERVSTGIPGLDAMADGGLWRGSTTLLVGPAGSGKTTMGQQFAIEGIRLGEPTLQVSLGENRAQLVRQLVTMGLSPEEIAALNVICESPVELQIDSLIVSIFRFIEEKGIRRLVIDSVGDLQAAASDPGRLFDYLYSLKQYLAVRGVTCVLTLEIGASDRDMSVHGHLSDNLIELFAERGSRLVRRLAIVKMRASHHDLEMRDMMIDAKGVHIP
jgi:circadian clock protein KaiC